MAGTNEMGSVEGQLVGLPLAGPETFTVQQLAYLKKALGLDETVLWEKSSSQSSVTSCTLSEDYHNFEKLKVYTINNDTQVSCVEMLTASQGSTFSVQGGAVVGTTEWLKHSTFNLGNTSISLSGAMNCYITSGGLGGISFGTTDNYLLKVVGVNRIAGGN